MSALTCEVVKSLMNFRREEETWVEESLDILLETWNVILEVFYVPFATSTKKKKEEKNHFGIGA